MKKRNVIIIIIAVLIVIAILGIVIYKNVREDNKEYQIEKVKQYNYFILKQNDLYGVIDRQGNTVVQTEYTEIKIPNPEKPVFVCYQGKDTKVLNEKGQEILEKYNNIQPIRLKNISTDLMYEKSVLKYEEDSKIGLIDFDGKELAKPIYDEIDSLTYKEGELLVKKDDKYGVINIKGDKIIENDYDEIKVDEYYSDENHYKYAGYIVSRKTEEGYRYGYINKEGKQILGTEYNEIIRETDIFDNENPYLICAKNGQYGVIKGNNKIIVNEYKSIQYDENNKVFVLEKSKKYGVANLQGDIIVPIKYDEIDITGIYLYAKDENGTTIYDDKGTEMNVDKDIAILNTSSEKYKIKINNKNGTKYGVIDKDEKQLIEEKYNYMEYFYDNYFIASNENGKLGILDDSGMVKIALNHDSLQKIQNTDLIQLVATENQMTEIYDKTMQKICEMKDAIIQESDSCMRVYNDSECRYFDKNGKELKSTEVYPNNKLFVNVKDGKYGFVDKNGDLVVDYKYDKAYEFNEYGFATIKMGELYGAIDEQGNESVPPVYEIKEKREPSFIGKYYRVVYGVGEFYYTDAK